MVQTRPEVFKRLSFERRFRQFVTVPSEVPKTVFLVETTVQLTEVLACLAGLKIEEAAVFVERNLSPGTTAMDPLLASARSRFPKVRFIELEIKRPPPRKLGERYWNSFFVRWREVRSIREQLDAACRKHLGAGLQSFGAQVQTVYFTLLHDYVLVFLAACSQAKRVLYPHGYISPLHHQAKEDLVYLYQRRSLRTLTGTLARQIRDFGIGGLALGVLGRLLPGITTICLPFSGVNQVLLFRSDIDYIPNEVMQVPGLADVFQWLLQLPPWNGQLQERRKHGSGKSVLLLLSEYGWNPIWEKNRSYGLSHFKLLQAMSQATGLKRFVIKAHVRSDGSAAEWLIRFLKEREPGWEIEILPLMLSGLPVEMLALTDEFMAACSLGSCSFSPGLGFGIPHYVSPVAATLFDEGWEHPFWAKFAGVARALIKEGICRDLDQEIKRDARTVVTGGKT